MATSTPIEIQVTAPPDESEADIPQDSEENKLRKWLQVVDDHIEDHSVEIMKLGMRSEFHQTELDTARKASDIYNILANKHDEALARFVYALEKLGHRRHGFRAVRKLKEFSIKKPSQYMPSGGKREVQKFNFFQCLVEICVHLDANLYSRLFAYSAKVLLDGTNPKKFETPCKLLICLVNREVMHAGDQTKLVEGLRIIGADKCIEYIHYYRHLNNLPEIADGDQTYASLRSTTSSITDEEGTLHRRVHFKKQTPSQELDSSLQTTTTEQGRQTNGLPPDERDGDQEEQPESRQQGTPEDGEESNEVPNRKKGKKKRACIYVPLCQSCMIAVCSTLALFTCVTLLTIYGVAQNLHNQESTTSLYYENTTVILAQVYNLFTSSLTVTEDTKHIGDFYRDIEIQQVDFSCTDLPTRIRQMANITNESDISAINGTTFYALAGSSVVYNICGVTNYTTTKLERLELLLHRQSLSELTEFDFFHVGTKGEWQCRTKTLYVDEPDYYTITFLSPTHVANFMFNVSYLLREIDSKKLYGRAISNHTLHVDQDTFEFVLALSFTYSCFVATIRENPITLKQTVHIQLKFLDRVYLYIIGGVVTSCFLTLALILCVLCVISCVHSRKDTHKSSEHEVSLQTIPS